MSQVVAGGCSSMVSTGMSYNTYLSPLVCDVSEESFDHLSGGIFSLSAGAFPWSSWMEIWENSDAIPSTTGLS